MAEVIDSYGRHLNYVRISVTDRCNFRCSYCMPPEGVQEIDHAEIMRYEEILRLCVVFRELGVRKFRFTGGEPLVRKDIVSFLAELRFQLPDVKIAMTTNGFLLKKYAQQLADVGIDSLNISLDTLDCDKFSSITRVDGLEKVFSGIKASVKSGIKNIKINTVLIKGFNDTEIPELLKFSKKAGVLLRLIEFMPLQDSIWNEKHFISSNEMLRILQGMGEWKLEDSFAFEDGPAKYYCNAKNGDRIGIIAAVSHHFCDSCNRLRVSASGNLRTCLFSPQEFPLRALIRNPDTAKLKNAIFEQIKNKPKCWRDIRTGKSHMSSIGG